jgi:hypothetical protein
MVGKRRASPALALCACFVLPATALAVQSVRGKVRQQQTLSRILVRAKEIGWKLSPDLDFIELEASYVPLYRSSRLQRELWSVQICDRGGTYVGETLWDANTGELLSTSWTPRRTVLGVSRVLKKRDAAATAKLRLGEVDESMTGVRVRSIGQPHKAGGLWLVWYEAAAARFRVKLDAATGSLVSAQRRDRPSKG